MAPDPIERGLAAGFGPALTPAQSVLRVIERITGEAPRVLLRDSNSEHGTSPVIDLSSPDRKAVPQGRGSYQMLGEIARGGMGVVMKGRDVDLGRDVALKVLHKELAKRPEVVQRFVEEAQIGGQLQHPGIVPVYELGLMADERPYFTMKLVKGRTLAVLLSERKVATAERRKLLDVFESVCQTLAYAHSRGVIHRDLKPANVMVGAFGEVQVVDWGLAKVLASGGTADEKRAKQSNISIIETVRSDGSGSGSHSLVGSVMGTPAYMPPEQARGEIDKVNERSDVFSLGAILCEILTGLPPYVGESEKTIELAAKAQLDDATKRLDGCEADADLVALAKECLAPAQQARPRDAGIVAQRVHDYLTSVEERAREAQVDAAEARVKAAEERKARTLTLALGSSVLVTVLVAGGGWAWMSSERASRERETETQVNAALSEATLRRGEGKWAEALAAVERARGLAASGTANAELHARVASDVAAIDNDAKLAHDKERLVNDNAALIAELEDIRQPEGHSYDTDHAKLDQTFAAIFEKHDLFLDQGTVEETVAKLSARNDSVRLAAMVYDWHLARSRAGNKDGAARLWSIVPALDHDEIRDHLRTALEATSVSELKGFASSKNLASLSAATLNNLGWGLLCSKAYEESVVVYRTARGLYPNDFVLARGMAEALMLSTPPAYQEATRHLTAALALRPTSVEVRHVLGKLLDENLDEHVLAEQVFQEAIILNPSDSHLEWHLGQALLRQKLDKEAIAEFRKAIQLDSKNAIAHYSLGLVFSGQGELDLAIAEYEAAIDIDTTDADFHAALGRALQDRNRPDAAIREYRAAIAIDATDTSTHCNLGAVLQVTGKLDQAIKEYQTAIDIDPTAPDVHNYLAIAWRDYEDPVAAIDEYRIASALDSSNSALHQDLGRELRIAGDWKNAIKEWEMAVRLDPKSAVAHILLGTARWHQGRAEETLDEMREAVRADETSFAAHQYLAWVLDLTGARKESLCECVRALDIDGKNVSMLGSLAWNLATSPDLALRDGEKAVGYAERARDLAPNDPNSFNNLGAALCCAEKWPAAIEALNHSIELNRDASDIGQGTNALGRVLLALAYSQLSPPQLDEAHKYLELAEDWHKTHPKSSDPLTLARMLDEARAAIEAGEKK